MTGKKAGQINMDAVGVQPHIHGERSPGATFLKVGVNPEKFVESNLAIATSIRALVKDQ